MTAPDSQLGALLASSPDRRRPTTRLHTVAIMRRASPAPCSCVYGDCRHDVVDGLTRRGERCRMRASLGSPA